jgi:hypothetical protein
MYTKCINSRFATETHIQKQITAKNSENFAALESAFSCFRVSDRMIFLSKSEAKQSA